MSGVDKAQPEHVPARRRSKVSACLRGRGVNIVPTPKDEEEPEKPKLPSHRWFEPERVPASERAQAVVDDVLNQVQNYEKYFGVRKRARRKADQETFEATVTAVVSDLIFNHVSGEQPGLAITRSNTKLGRKSRYGSPALGKTLPTTLDRLSSPEMGFVRQDVGGQEFFKENRTTTIYPGERLVSRIDDADLQVDDLGVQRFRETIILKRRKTGHFDKGERIEYADTEVTIRYRQEMERINNFLASADIDFHDIERPDGRIVDTQERWLRRSFTNGSFQSGGRLFGGFWQNLKKAERSDDLYIDGLPVVTLDYSQMALRIAYGDVGCIPPDGDGYLLPGLEEYRAATKMIFNSALSSDKQLTRAPQGSREYLPKEIAFIPVLRQLEEHHAPIAQLFYKGEGHRLQFVESQILVSLLLRLQEDGIVALPIHDAVVITDCDAKKTKILMEKVFKDQTGVDAIVIAE